MAKYRYLLFMNDQYYPVHGMKGCNLKTNNFEEVLSTIDKWKHIFDYVSYYDVETGKTFDVDKDMNVWEVSQFE